MKILFLTNFYPPASRGGYEQWCQEIADGLKDHGHDVLVLASMHGKDFHEADPSWVRRELYLEMEFTSLKNAFQFFTSRKKREKENLSCLRSTVLNFAPDVMLMWGMWNFPRSLPALAEQLMPGRTAYYMGDYWPALPSQFENYWNAPPRNRITGFPKSLLKPIAQGILAREDRPSLQLERVMFPSEFLQKEFERKGIIPHDSKIVYGAIDTKPYLDERAGSKHKDGLSLLYIGRLTPEKGVHTAIESAGQLVHEHGLKNLKLTIVGNGEPEYVEFLYQIIEQNGLASSVTILPAQPKEVLPSLYQTADVLLFTSIWPEPFGRVIVEAMASGITVIGTPVGGAAEILVDGENALTFIPDDPNSLSEKLRRLIAAPKLREQLSKAGRDTAIRDFDIQRMTAEIESYLQTLVR